MDFVGDLITDDDSIRFLRSAPSEHYGGESGLTSDVRHDTRHCIHACKINSSAYIIDSSLNNYNIPSSSVRIVLIFVYGPVPLLLTPATLKV